MTVHDRWKEFMETNELKQGDTFEILHSDGSVKATVMFPEVGAKWIGDNGFVSAYERMEKPGIGYRWIHGGGFDNDVVYDSNIDIDFRLTHAIKLSSDSEINAAILKREEEIKLLKKVRELL